MNSIEKLIDRYCPDGVEIFSLQDITKSIKTGLNPRQNFKLSDKGYPNYYVTVKEITTGKIRFSDKTNRINNEALKIIQNRSCLEVNDILFSGIGTIGKVAIVDIPTDNWNCSESVFLIKPKVELVAPKFLMYMLQSDLIVNQYSSQSVGSTLKGVRMGSLLNMTIPVPPLEVQEEIIYTLDKFTALEAELEAELEARTRQYDYYRNQLFVFANKKVSWKKIGEVGEIIRGVAFTKKQSITGKYPVIANAPNAISYHNECNRKGEFIVIARSGANAGLVSYWNEELFLTDAFSIHLNNALLNTKFIFYYLKNLQREIHLMKEGSGVPHVRASDFEIYNIPIIPLEEQERIVNILDQFDAMVNDIKIGLPAEIKARRQQYEYYRSKLLTFEKIG